MRTCDPLGNLAQPFLRHRGCVHILVPFPTSSGLPLLPPLPKGTQRRQNKPQSWNLPLSSLSQAERFPRSSRAQLPPPASWSHSICSEVRPLVVALISPPPHCVAPAQLVVCNRLDQETTSSDHRGTERNKWLKQARWLRGLLGSHTLLFQPPDMCFSGNTGNYPCPLRKGRVFSACVWGFQTIPSSQAPSGPWAG